MRVVTSLVTLILAAQQASTPRLNSLSAKDHIGEVATICGHVIGYGCSQTDGTSLRFATNNTSIVEFRIPYDDRGKFGVNPEDQYLDRIVCTSGLIEKREKARSARLEIVVTDPKAIDVRADRPGLPAFAPGIRRPCDSDTILPKVKREVRPAYTNRALEERIEGAVLLQMVVEADGTVGDARVIRSLHRDLDQEAVRAARRWRFEPGTFQGKPVPLVVVMEMTFSRK
jgi:TonB family protein